MTDIKHYTRIMHLPISTLFSIFHEIGSPLLSQSGQQIYQGYNFKPVCYSWR